MNSKFYLQVQVDWKHDTQEMTLRKVAKTKNY